MNNMKSNPLGTNERDQLLKLQLRGYVVNRDTKADQELANRYYRFCDQQKFTFVEIRPGRKASEISVDLFDRVRRLDAQAKAEVGALLRRNGAVYDVIPRIVDVPNQLAPQVAQELLRIAEAMQKRAKKTPDPADALIAVAAEKKA